MESDKHQRRCVLVPGLTLVLLGCAVGPSGGPLGGEPGGAVARLTADAPGIEVRRAGQVVQYAPSMPLYKGDDVRTGGGTSATIEFTDGNVVYVRENTSLEVGTIRLFFGEIFNLIRSIAGGGSTVYTNDLAAAAETTMFLVRRDATHGTTVTVVEGTVRCRPAAGGGRRGPAEAGRWAMVPVRQDQQLTVASATVARPSIAMVDARGSAQWVNTTAQRLNRPIAITPRDGQPPVMQPPPAAPPRRPPPVMQPPPRDVQPPVMQPPPRNVQPPVMQPPPRDVQPPVMQPPPAAPPRRPPVIQ
jgi:FecR protein